MKLLPILMLIPALVACDKLGIKQQNNLAAHDQSAERVVEGGVAVGSADAFKGKRQLVVGGFSVGFVESKDIAYRTKPGPLSNKPSVTYEAQLTLTDVDQELKQQIVDATYVNFVERLEAAGYDVIERTALLRDDDFQRTLTKPSPLARDMNLGDETASVTLMAPTSIGKLYDTNTSGFANPITAAIDFAGRKRTPVLFVEYVVDFAHAKKGNEWWNPGQPVTVNESISLSPGGGVSLIGGQADARAKRNGYVKLSAPVYSTDPFTQLAPQPEKKEGLEDAVEYVSLMFDTNENKPQFIDVKADPVPYGMVTTMLLAEANYKLVSKMKDLR